MDMFACCCIKMDLQPFLDKQLLLLLIAAEEQTDKTAAFIEVLTLNDDQLLLLHKS